MNYGRLFRFAVVVSAFTALVSSSAWAQTPSYSLSVSDGHGTPGSEVVLNIILSTTQDVAGVNFTVNLDANNGILAFKQWDGQKCGELGPDVPSTGFSFDDHLLGQVGDKLEYRAILYSNASTPAAIPTKTNAVIAKVHFTVNSSAVKDQTVKVKLNNAFTADTTPVRLVALSNATGQSIGGVNLGDSQGRLQITVAEGTFTVDQGSLFGPLVVDFKTGVPSTWSAQQIRPTYDATASQMAFLVSGTGMGLKVVSKANDCFGYFTSPSDAGIIPKMSTNQMLLRAAWSVSSNDDNQKAVPGFRLRLNGTDNAVAEMLEIKSPETVGKGRLAPTTAGSVFNEYFIPRTSTQNDMGPSGYTMSFDLSNFDANYGGPIDSQIVLRNIDVRGIALPETFSPVAGTSFDFSSAGTDTKGWSANIPNPLVTLLGEQFTNTASSDVNNGLILKSTNTDKTGAKYALGIWDSPDLTLAGSDTILYRLTLTMQTTTTNPSKTPHFRVRVFSKDYQWTRHFEVAKKANNDGTIVDDSMVPAASPSTTAYDIYFTYPSQVDTVAAKVSLDLINIETADDPNGGFKLIKSEINQAPLPTFP